MKDYLDYKEKSISGRYLTNVHLEKILEKLSLNFQKAVLGQSVQGRSVYSVKFGTGPTKIFMWSQMHGNESTTTKALFDFFNFLDTDNLLAKKIATSCTLFIIPIVNPDGAAVYTRVNANQVDLNRDSVQLTQPESQILRKVFEEFKPDFCFNLHDQRTIFGVGDSGMPATVSFLAPSFNEACEYNECRLRAVSVILAINEELQKYIPNQIGRFDDAFNLNCIGDYFQSSGVPTILFEAGHFQNDYEREETRKYVFISYIRALQHIISQKEDDVNLNEYLNIPQNKINFYDFIYKNVRLKEDSLDIITKFASHYKEVLFQEKVHFEAEIVKIGDLERSFAHQVYDLEGGLYQDEFGNYPKLEKNTNFSVNINNIFVNGLRKK
ncbi:M14 metallopeptidase family protein [Flavobacterium oreochromis]|uniref:M14 metallopeptidase family protein n=1 Tax=Flavobacterium oreochromis TaxID=2906078 RepID=A0ABW8P8I0_9FLAO|nr:M14 metallopeptidase family protein [Flavobacterium oreochromis]OWP76932.1 peptidase M14 [Flavobacterium oreochromis]POR18007.1 peptidase M14 [Flavobacterium columnare]